MAPPPSGGRLGGGLWRRMRLCDRTYAGAFRRGGVEGRRPSTNQLLAARGGRAVEVAPGRRAAAGGNRGMRGGEASPHPSTAYVLLFERYWP